MRKMISGTTHAPKDSSGVFGNIAWGVMQYFCIGRFIVDEITSEYFVVSPKLGKDDSPGKWNIRI